MAETTLNKELADGLRQAKKKSRNFALIVKGPNPVKLIVQKKPLRDGEVAKAKIEFKGNAVIRGVVQGEGAEHVFYVQGEEPNVKTVKLKEYIAEQTELTVKPRFSVVLDLPDVSEEDEEALAETESSEPSLEASVAPPSPPPGSPLPPPPAPAPIDSKQLLAALNKLSPNIQAAAKNQPERKSELLKLVADFQQQLQSEELSEAKATLGLLIKLVKELSAAPAAAPADATAAATSAAAAAPGPFVAFQKSRLDWDSTRKAIQSELQKLEQSILSICQDEPDLDQIAAGTKNLYKMLDKLDTRLIDKLDDALNAEQPAQRQKLQDEAYDIVAEYREFVESDPLLQDIDKNGFLAVNIRSKLTATLSNLAARLVA